MDCSTQWRCRPCTRRALALTPSVLVRHRFPADYPDTAAGQRHDAALASVAKAAAMARPKSKRPNFRRLRRSDPYGIPWSSLWARDSDGDDEHVDGSGPSDDDGDHTGGSGASDGGGELAGGSDGDEAKASSADREAVAASDSSHDDDCAPTYFEVCVVRGAFYLDALVPSWPRPGCCLPAVASPAQPTLLRCHVKPWRLGSITRLAAVRRRQCVARGTWPS